MRGKLHKSNVLPFQSDLLHFAAKDLVRDVSQGVRKSTGVGRGDPDLG